MSRYAGASTLSFKLRVLPFGISASRCDPTLVTFPSSITMYGDGIDSSGVNSWLAVTINAMKAVFLKTPLIVSDWPLRSHIGSSAARIEQPLSSNLTLIQKRFVEIH